MATQFGTFTEDAPAQSTGDFNEHPVTPDIRSQDSHSYAGAVATQKVQDLYAASPSAPPTVEKMWDFYDKAYDEAEKFKQGQVEASLAQQRALQQRVIELSPNPKTGLSLIQTEAAERAQIEQQKQQILQGPSAVAQSQAQGGSYIEREAKDYGDKISAVGTDFAGIDRLSKLHDQMTTNSPIGTGGFLKSAFGHTREAAMNMSPDARAYFGLADLMTPTFGKGIQGDLPAATTKANIIEMMDKNVIPNEIDNPQSAHNKWFNLYNQGFTVLNNLRNQMKTEGQDTSRVDGLLVDGNNWLKTHSTWDPVKSQPLVQAGISDQSKQVINNTVNQAIGATTPAQGQAVQPPQATGAMAAPPSYGSPAVPGAYTAPPAIANQPSGAEKLLVNAPGQLWNLFKPKPGGPTQDLTQPTISSLGTYTGQ